MRLSADRYEGERRKYILALSMVEHGARLGTIAQWTGLSKWQVHNLTNSYPSATRSQPRGASPCQPAYFSKSLKVARESTAFAYIAFQMQAIPEGEVPDAPHSLPGVARGERFMSAFEVYRALLPNPLISLEYAILLITELAERRTLVLARCSWCPEVIVLDRLGSRDGRCPRCRLKRRGRKSFRDLSRQQ